MKRWIANWDYDQYQTGTVEVSKIGPKKTRINSGSAQHSRYRNIVSSAELFETEEAMNAHYFPKIRARIGDLKETIATLEALVKP